MERIIRVSPAHDKRSKGGGIHNVEMIFVLKGEAGAVTFTLGTGIYLPETTEWRQTCIAHMNGDDSTWYAKGYAVGYCSPKPLYEYQINQGREKCSWLGCTCYGDVGYSIADKPFDLLIRQGSEALWEWLENYYKEVFETETQNA